MYDSGRSTTTTQTHTHTDTGMVALPTHSHHTFAASPAAFCHEPFEFWHTPLRTSRRFPVRVRYPSLRRLDDSQPATHRGSRTPCRHRSSHLSWRACRCESLSKGNRKWACFEDLRTVDSRCRGNGECTFGCRLPSHRTPGQVAELESTFAFVFSFGIIKRCTNRNQRCINGT